MSSVFKVMNRLGNVAFGQNLGNQVDDKNGKNRDGSEKLGRLIWYLKTYVKRLDSNVTRKKTVTKLLGKKEG